ncbi:MAG: hypothetical protein MHMPM18_003754 [Marteilia pararefringens]
MMSTRDEYELSAQCVALAECEGWLKYANSKGDLLFMRKNEPKFSQRDQPISWQIEKERIILSKSDEENLKDLLKIPQQYISKNIDYSYVFDDIGIEYTDFSDHLQPNVSEKQFNKFKTNTELFSSSIDGRILYQFENINFKQELANLQIKKKIASIDSKICEQRIAHTENLISELEAKRDFIS